MDQIRLQALEIPCCIGVYAHEHRHTQPVVAELTLELDLEPAAHSDALRDTVDFALVAQQLRFLLIHGRFRLLETAALVAAKTLLLPPKAGESRAAIDAMRLRLSKPEALRNTPSGGGMPSVEVYRRRTELAWGLEVKEFGSVDVLHETSHAGFYRLNIAPGQSIPAHQHQIMEEAELILSPGLLCDGEPAAPGSERAWPKGQVHRYDNPTEVEQSLLCIDRPPFIESDERPVSA